MFKLLQRAVRGAYSTAVAAIAKLQLASKGVHFGEGAKFYGRPIVSCCEGSEIRIGRCAVLCSWSSHTALGVNHPVVLRTLRPGALISIGEHVGISGGTICAAVEVTIGAETMLGANVTIADTDFHPLSPEQRRYSHDAAQSARVRIGRNVFIGTNSVILKGVEIGDDSVIGAGSIVTRSLPAGVIAAGNPCRVLRELSVAPQAQMKR